MIRQFKIQNFKSLDDFQLPPSPHGLGRFVCLVGLNGAGKSTVLQAFDFVGQLVTGKVDDWLERREWTASDLRSEGKKRQPIPFEVSFAFPNFGDVIWRGIFYPHVLRCQDESIVVNGSTVLRRDGRQRFVVKKADNEQAEIPLGSLEYLGSVLSLLRTDEFHPALGAVKQYAQSLKSLELLNPQAMRRRTRAWGDIGIGGERLAGYLHGIPQAERQRLDAMITEFYPQFRESVVKSFPAGWKELIVKEEWSGLMSTRARHVNDGLLRLIAILSQIQFRNGGTGEASRCILFDEIENGINPELMENLIGKLREAKDQIVVTTHSPMILNWLPDDVAREAVILLYRSANGSTKAVRMFDLPTAEKRLGVLGPGEVFVDVDLAELAGEAVQLSETPA